jgi:hypothetical protein
VPAGWKAVWNDQYKEYFYVNIYTKKSQWDAPTAPVYPPDEAPPDGAPPGAPPAYDTQNARPAGIEKPDIKSPLGGTGPGGSGLTEDERLARQLQDEENARAGLPHGAHSPLPNDPNRGASDSYYNDGPPQGQSGYGSPQPASYGQQNQGPYDASGPQDKGKSKGLLGKLAGGFLGKNKYPQQQQQQPQYYPQPQQQYPQQGYGYPQQGYPPGQGQYGRKPGGMGNTGKVSAI